MNLLGAILYDPGTAATKSTASLIAMTAVDTTNLRIAFTIPAHGMVAVRMSCVIEGGLSFPCILLGILNGATVVARINPETTFPGASGATSRMNCKAEFVISGLTPGAVNWDAAYGVEIVVISSNIKYGGPNDTTTDNAWGGFLFEVYDPQPIPSAGVPTAAANATAVRTELATELARIDVATSTRLSTAGYTAPPSAATNAAQVRTELTTELARIDAATSSRMATYTQPTGFLAASFPTDPADQSLIIAATDAIITAVAGVQSDTDNIQTRLPAVLTADGNIKSDSLKLNGATPNNLAAGAAMTLDMTQAVPTSNTAQTMGDALNAARAQGFGKWALVGTTLTLYAADGTTALRAFTLDSATAPTSRT